MSLQDPKDDRYGELAAPLGRPLIALGAGEQPLAAILGGIQKSLKTDSL